jgi:hypothetical protein
MYRPVKICEKTEDASKNWEMERRERERERQRERETRPLNRMPFKRLPSEILV